MCLEEGLLVGVVEEEVILQQEEAALPIVAGDRTVLQQTQAACLLRWHAGCAANRHKRRTRLS